MSGKLRAGRSQRMPSTKVTRAHPLPQLESPDPVRSCQHLSTINADGLIICEDCGEEINRLPVHDKEWRYYGGNDSKHTSDPNRVQMRKTEERTIFKDVENMGFSEKIVADANKIYLLVTSGRIYRGSSRKGIVFACIFHAYNAMGNHQSHERLIEVFKLTRKSALKGLRHVSVNLPKDSNVKINGVTPVSIVEEIMNLFSATSEQKKQVTAYYDLIKNKSSKLNRSRPQSVASGLVYYWMKTEEKSLTLKEFAEKVKLSELTITNIAKEIAEVMKTPNIFWEVFSAFQ